MDRGDADRAWLYVNSKMNMKKGLLILLTFHFSLLVSLAQQGDAQIRQKISQAAAAMKTMQCDFVQTKHLKMLSEEMVSKGRMCYQQSQCLRWEYTSPYDYTLIINHDKVLLKNRQRQDVIDVNQNRFFKEIASIMMNSVVGNCLNDDKSFKSTVTARGGEWVATLTPQRRDMKQMFKEIVLHFSQREAMVTQVELIEKNGDRTTIELKNVKTNETISPDMFTVR